MIAAKLCEYTENYWIEQFKWVNCMLCALYLNGAVKNRNKGGVQGGEKK